MTPLTERSLRSLRPSVAVPSYDRSRVRAGVVHLGVGGFHRSHEAVYLDRLLSQGASPDWGVCGVGVLPGDRRMAEVMAAQDCLWTLLVRHADGSLDARVIGSMVEYLFAPADPEAVVATMADPATRIVSLTVTEGGYNTSAVTGRFDEDNPDVQADLRSPTALRTSFGLVTEALARRRERGTPPFTVVSCDNMPGNGEVARLSFGAFAGLRDPRLGDWVEREVPFPNSMVDRITPATTDADRAELEQRFGVADRWPVVCEPWTQWILEDTFADGRPPLEDVGVQLVDDVGPYELMKLRLLNAGHQVLAHLGALAGLEHVHEAAADPLLRRLLDTYLDEEATPTLRPVPGIDLDAYKREVVARFASPAVRDTLDRIRSNSSDRMPQFVLPVLRANLASGGPIRCAVTAVAGWAHAAEGADDDGRPLELVDARADALASRARSGDPLAFVADRELFGDLVDDERFTAAYLSALESLRTRGARATLASLV